MLFKRDFLDHSVSAAASFCWDGLYCMLRLAAPTRRPAIGIGSVEETVGDQENSRREVRGESQERDGARVLQFVPSLRISITQLALFRGCENRAHPLHGEVGRAVAAH